jgi:broad specificity phosphatase PhoE
MKWLEMRRHSHRKTGTGGSQLSREGVALARALGATMGLFARVITTVSPRTRETAVAMGFAVDYELVPLNVEPDVYTEAGGNPWWEAPEPFVALAELVAGGGAYSRYAHALASLCRDIMTALPDGEAALLIGHSGELESALVALFPDADHAAWGRPFGPCEGARLTFSGEPERFTDIKLIRLPMNHSAPCEA